MVAWGEPQDHGQTARVFGPLGPLDSDFRAFKTSIKVVCSIHIAGMHQYQGEQANNNICITITFIIIHLFMP